MVARDDAEVELAVREIRLDLAGEVAAHLDLDLRMLLREARHDGPQEDVDVIVRHAEAHAALRRRAPDVVDHQPFLLQPAPGAADELLARRRERHAARAAVEEPLAEILLEVGDAGGDRGLRAPSLSAAAVKPPMSATVISISRAKGSTWRIEAGYDWRKRSEHHNNLIYP